jgi:hypothetical protein
MGASSDFSQPMTARSASDMDTGADDTEPYNDNTITTTATIRLLTIRLPPRQVAPPQQENRLHPAIQPAELDSTMGLWPGRSGFYRNLTKWRAADKTDSDRFRLFLA